ncbi:MAG TPA: GAF domain-containing protein [Sphingomonas sp.]|nr:GAF domain-containing protein [Sphingomonas sp.]
MGISFYFPPKTPVNEQDRIDAIRTSRLMDPRLGNAIGMIVRSAAALAKAPAAAATIIVDDCQIVLGGFRFEQTPSRRSTSICGHTILEAPAPMCVPDLAEDPRFVENPYVIDPPHVRFYFGTPLLSPTGHAMGALCVFDVVPRARPSPPIATALQDMAAHIVALPDMRVFQSLPSRSPHSDTIV